MKNGFNTYLEEIILALVIILELNIGGTYSRGTRSGPPDSVDTAGVGGVIVRVKWGPDHPGVLIELGDATPYSKQYNAMPQ